MSYSCPSINGLFDTQPISSTLPHSVCLSYHCSAITWHLACSTTQCCISFTAHSAITVAGSIQCHHCCWHTAEQCCIHRRPQGYHFTLTSTGPHPAAGTLLSCNVASPLTSTAIHMDAVSPVSHLAARSATSRERGPTNSDRHPPPSMVVGSSFR
jgi:hypothetical protein